MKRKLLLSLFVVILSCTNKSPEKKSSDPFLDLNKTVVSQPPPIMSISATIDLSFNSEVIPPHMAGTVIDKSPFAFKPSIDGQAKWLSQTSIRFTPYQNLKPGTSYTGIFKGKTAFGDNHNVNNYEFTFKTAEQEVLSFLTDFIPADTGKNMVRLTGLITFAQPVDLSRLKKDLACLSNKKRLSIDLSVKTDDTRAVNLALAPMQRGDKPILLSFTLPESYRADQKKWREDIILPEASAFKVISHMDLGETQGNKSIYGFRFSDPVKKNIDLSGFISIVPSIDYTVSTDGKYLKIHAAFIHGNDYTIRLSKGLPCALGTTLSDDYQASFSYDNLKPEVKWLSKGIYLPSDNQFKVQLKSINVREVNVSVTEIYDNNMGFFLQNNVLHDQQMTDEECYDCEYFSSYSYSDLERVGKEIYSKSLKITDMKNKWVTTELDLANAFSGKKNAAFVVTCSFNESKLCGRCINDRNDLTNDDLYYNDDDYYKNPCQGGYYYRHGTISKLLIASDIALTLKIASDGLHVYAINALKAKPVSGLALARYSYQNQILERVTTDVNGHALFSSSDGHYIRGEEKGSLAIIRLNRPSWELSSYDIAGVDEMQSGIDAFMYTDRGVHRPGDTIHISAIIRSDRKAPPEDQMVSLRVSNPLDQTVFEGKQKCGKNGHLHFAVQTDIQDPTGNYLAELKIANVSTTKTLKIETVKPNRLKINLGIADTIRDSQGRVKGSLESRYLFGTPAAGHRAVIRADYSAQPISIPVLADYTFSHPLRSYSQRDQEITDTELDNEGKTAIDYTIDDISNVPELLNARYRVTVYEKGGGFTSHSKHVIVAPYSAFAGIKNVFRYSSARLGENYDLPIIFTDLKGQLIAGHELTVRWYVNKRYWWYDYDNRDKKDFRTSDNTYKIAEFKVISGDKPIIQKFEIDDAGQHFIEVIDEQGGHSAGLFFWASSWGQEAPSEKAQQPLLAITSNKNVYYTGDQAVFSCETPKAGLAIFTVEQGSRILHQEVKKVNLGRTDFPVRITSEFVPNCYATISLIQPANRSGNDLPLRIYGLKPVMVEDPSTRLQLSLQAPDEIKANQRFELKVSSSDPREATFTVAVVDEGLLDLTGFDTPDAWKHYFQKRRLGVLSSDNFEEILSSLVPGVDKRFSIGGDLGEESKRRTGESRIQRFKPVVLFNGPVTLKPGKTSVLSFQMPNYSGSVRIMIVGSAQNSYSSLEKTVPVRQDLMVLPTVPRVARPGDLFSVPVSVFAMNKKLKNVTVGIKVSGNLNISGSHDTVCTFEKSGENDVTFSVGVGKFIGASTIIVNAVSGQYRTADTTTLPITAPNPYFIRVSDTLFSSNSELSVIARRIGIEGTNRARIAVSRFPDIQIDKRLKDLIRYPYGCIEQTTSSVFPQLYIGKLVDLKNYQNLNVTDNLNAGIQRLQNFKIDGGFSYWPSSQHYNSEVSDWGSNYVGHFLIEARKAGYYVPDGLFNHWLSYAKDKAKKINKSNFRFQTYDLFLLSLAGKPHIGAMNLVRENHLDDLDPLSKKMLAGAYFLAGQHDAAEQIDKHMTTGIPVYREMGETYGSSLRDRCMIAYISYTMGDKTTAVKLLRSIAHDFYPEGWYSTQETAFALMAICTIYSDANIVGGSRVFTMEFQNGKTKEIELKGYQMSMDISKYFDEKITIRTDKADPLFVSIFEEGIPLEDIIKTEQQGLELARNFYDEDGNTISVDDISQGDQFWIRYRVRSTTGQQLKELALSSVFPSGWEIINSRMEGEDLPQWVSNMDVSNGKYMDIRDDRVNWFFDLNHNSEANFMIKCNATFAGTFRLPPVTVEPMYSPESYARIAGQIVTVK